MRSADERISQGCAATEFRCGGKFYFTIFRRLSTNSKVKELGPIEIGPFCQSYCKKVAPFYGP